MALLIAMMMIPVMVFLSASTSEVTLSLRRCGDETEQPGVAVAAPLAAPPGEMHHTPSLFVPAPRRP